MEGCRSETRTSSQSSGPGSTGTEFPPQDFPKTDSTSTEWTDEKHSLYLKSMEASFVNQLYNSMDLLAQPLQKEMSDPKPSHQVLCNTRAPSGQFKVLRSGCWQKVNFQRPDSQVNTTNEPNGLLISPWIQHFRYTRKPQESAGSQSQGTNLNGKKALSSTTTCSKHSYLCHCYLCHHSLVESNTEVSDQNFVDEDTKGEKISSTSSSKRMKTQTMSTSSNDQVVPSGKPPVIEDATEKCISVAR